MPFRIAFIILCFCISSNLLSKNKIEWWNGSIELNTGQILEGNISYDSEMDVVCFLDSGNIKSFTASKVKSFEYYDDEIEEKRIFVSLDYQYSSSYRPKVFFEVMVSGKIKMVRRYKTFNQFYSIPTDLLKESFGSFIYFAYFDGKFINLKKFKSEVLPLLKRDYEMEMDKFIEDNKLNLKEVEHQVVLIDYYNFLTDPEREVFNMDYLVITN